MEVEKRASLPASVRERELGVTGASCSPSIVIPWEASNFKASSWEEIPPDCEERIIKIDWR